MARIDIISTFSEVRSDAALQFTEGTDFLAFCEVLRGLAVEALAEADATQFAGAQGRLSVEVQITDGGMFADPDDPTGEVKIIVSLGVENDLALGYSVPGSPVRAYLDAAILAFATAFMSLPDEGAALFAALGVSDASAQTLTQTRVSWSPSLP